MPCPYTGTVLSGHGAVQFEEGELLNLQGFSLKESAGIATVTKGTGSGYLINNGAGYAVGDTAGPAAHLIAMYEARGYDVVDSVQWPGKVYRSVVFAKRL